MKWFKHDTDAHTDAKLKRVQIKYGLLGYGLYWYCLELIANDVNHNKITFELEHDAEIIAHDTGVHRDVIQEMIAYMVGLGLFENDHGIITCLKLAKRLDSSMTSNPDMRKIIKSFNGKNHDEVMTGSCKIRLDKIRLDNTLLSPKRKITKFQKPTLQEISQYCQERQNGLDPQKILDHYETSGWMRGKTPIKNWKACVRTWESQSSNAPNDITLGAI